MIVDWAHTRIAIFNALGNMVLDERAVRRGAWAGWMREEVLWWVWGGAATMRARQGPVELGEGVAVWMRPGFEYGFEGGITEPLKLHEVRFDLIDTRDGSRVTDLPGLAERLVVRDAVFVQGMTDRIAGLAERIPRQPGGVFRGIHAERAQRLLIELLIELEQATPPTTGGAAVTDATDLELLRLGQRIAQDPASAEPVSAMAEQLGLTPDHFAKRFRQVNREKPQAYLLHHRTRHAGRLLAETALPVNVIARRLGYRDVYYFSRQFKQQTGSPPLKFRRDAREEAG